MTATARRPEGAVAGEMNMAPCIVCNEPIGRPYGRNGPTAVHCVVCRRRAGGGILLHQYRSKAITLAEYRAGRALRARPKHT